MAEHTPGPWKAYPDEVSGGFLVDLSDAPSTGVFPTHHQMVYADCVYPEDAQWGEVEANAHLIAAAPDMLEALECIEAGSGYAQLTDGKLNKIRAAIAKARGRV